MYISFILSGIVSWLEQRRLINLLLVIAYSVFVVLMHNPVVKLSVAVMNRLTLPVYNHVVTYIFSIFLISYCGFAAWQLKIHPAQRKIKFFYLLCTLAFILVHFYTMLEMNIEVIHIYEYASVCFLFFPFTRRFGAAVLFTLPVMLIDEWRQYMILYPGAIQYLELNDVMNDIYGCGLTVVTLYICNVRASNTLKRLWKRPEFIVLGIMLLLLLLAIKTRLVCLYPADACSYTYMVFDKLPNPELFWRQFPHRDVIYHVVTPPEGVTIITLLCLFYFGLDSMRMKKAD